MPNVWVVRKDARKLFDGDTPIELAVSTGQDNPPSPTTKFTLELVLRKSLEKFGVIEGHRESRNERGELAECR